MTSSTGAEVYALSAAARELVAVRNQLRELQYQVEPTSTLRGDNQSSILVATTPGGARQPGQRQGKPRRLRARGGEKGPLRSLFRAQAVPRDSRPGPGQRKVPP